MDGLNPLADDLSQSTDQLALVRDAGTVAATIGADRLVCLLQLCLPVSGASQLTVTVTAALPLVTGAGSPLSLVVGLPTVQSVWLAKRVTALPSVLVALAEWPIDQFRHLRLDPAADPPVWLGSVAV